MPIVVEIESRENQSSLGSRQLELVAEAQVHQRIGISFAGARTRAPANAVDENIRLEVLDRKSVV